MADYPNFQLLTSGIVNNNTSVLTDTNYDSSFWIFNLKLWGLGLINASNALRMTFQNDAVAGHYSNKMDGATTSAVTLTSDTNQAQDQFFTDLFIFWPGQAGVSTAVTVFGTSKYHIAGSANWITYNFLCQATPPAFGGGAPSPFLSIFENAGGMFSTGFYTMYGLTSRGATLLSTSTQGG